MLPNAVAFVESIQLTRRARNVGCLLSTGLTDITFTSLQMEYVRENKLAGAAIWAIDLDDFNGLCGERWPLLSAVNQNLNSE